MRENDRHRAYGQALWMALVSGASIVFSLALACAMPFVAVATIAAMFLTRRSAFILTVVGWLANQLVGYLVLGYPTTWDSFAWGGAIGIAALLALQAVVLLDRYVEVKWAALIAAFLGAFVVYEASLYVATAFLPSGEDAFSLAVVGQIFWTNALAMVLLLMIHRFAVLLGFPLDRREAGYAS